MLEGVVMQILKANSGAQVKFFTGFTTGDMETKLNAWLSENDLKIEIHDIKLAGVDNSFSALVIYRTNF